MTELHKVDFDSKGFAKGIYAPGDKSIPASAQDIPDNLLTTLSSDVGKYIVVSDGSSIVNVTEYTQTLSEAKAAQLSVLAQAAAEAYTAGFSSSALGSAHTYSSQITDQIKLSGAVTASQSPGLPAGWAVKFWCQDNSGNWAHTPHTAVQIQQVLADALTVAVGISSKLGTLRDQVNAVTTNASDVKSITWS